MSHECPKCGGSSGFEIYRSMIEVTPDPQYCDKGTWKREFILGLETIECMDCGQNLSRGDIS